ncbi:hypothetical protein PZ06_02475 [Lacticaseibacillus rhamnosus]|nr:hypothetical protein PZ06_02475 [Lacticaseibacillus rhamnosus]
MQYRASQPGTSVQAGQSSPDAAPQIRHQGQAQRQRLQVDAVHVQTPGANGPRSRLVVSRPKYQLPDPDEVHSPPESLQSAPVQPMN